MKREYYKQHSDVLNEDMSMIVYGEGGWPVIAFQAQDSKSNNFEDFGMIDVLAPFIDEGRIQVFSVDNLDEESWSDEGGDKGARAWRQEEYFRFVTDELLPRVHAWNNSDRRPIAVGCSMGATHAAIAALRRPDLFQGCIALSGVYSTSFFFGDYMDDNLYNNDVPAFLTNMAADHPYVDLYNQRQLVMCVGQGAWEMGIDDLRYIDSQLNRLGAKHWCDFWGYDVNHDWPWWRKQMPYFMNEVLGQIEAGEAEAAAKKAAEEAAKAEAAKKAKAEAAKKAAAEKKAKAEAAKKAEAEAKAKAAAEKKAAEEAAAKKAAEEAAAKAAAEKAEAEAKAKAEAEAKAKAEAEAAAKKAEEEAAAKAAAEAEAAKKAAATKKPAAKRTTTRKAAPKKTAAPAKAAEPKAEEPVAAAEAEAPATEAKPAAKKPAAKRTTTRKAATTKTTTAAKKPAAKRTTTRKAATPKDDNEQ